jgi:aspartate carbamoyltransferase catalytic subunit
MLKRQRTKDSGEDAGGVKVPDVVIAVRNLTREFVDSLLAAADEMKQLVKTKGGDERLKHKVLASVFYEPSTRTSCSFQAAMQRLGGTVICVNEKDSSAQKGESIEDTVQTMSCYCDAIVMRHPMKGSSEIAAKATTVPLINAGNWELKKRQPAICFRDCWYLNFSFGIIRR